MDFNDAFEPHFQAPSDFTETDLELFKKLQDTRHALQESISENQQLKEIIELLYSEARVENVATGELVEQIHSPLFKNIALPRNADSLPLSEKAGYAMYCMKFLGFATRKATEEFHRVKEHLEGMHSTVRKNVLPTDIPRTGSIKIPELDGDKEMKRGIKATAIITPPITPPKQQIGKEKSTK